MIKVYTDIEEVDQNIFNYTDMSYRGKLLFVYILSKHEDNFHFSPTEISRKLGCSVTFVRNAMCELEKNNILSKINSKDGSSRYEYTFNFYRKPKR